MQGSRGPATTVARQATQKKTVARRKLELPQEATAALLKKQENIMRNENALQNSPKS